VLDLEDFIVSNVLLPLGSLVIVLFCVLPRYGWGWKNFVAEANQGKGLKVANWMRWIVTIVIPIIILAMFIMGIVNFNFG
jgi:NSS family neurotransmitter:Na+ symporter